MASKDIAALLIGGGAKSPEAEGDDREGLAEQAFVKAVKSGKGVADALRELLSVIEGDEEETDEPVDDEEDELEM